MYDSYKFKWYDHLVILLNIAGGRGNILPYLILNTNKTTHVLFFVILINFIYICSRRSLFQTKPRLEYKYGAFLFPFLVVYNTIGILIRGDGDLVVNIEISFLVVQFSYILYHFTHTAFLNFDLMKNGIFQYTCGYLILSSISVLGIFITFALLSAGFDYSIPLHQDFLADNAISIDYKFSFFSVNNQSSLIRVPFFHDQGMLSGLFHENHIIAHNTFPFLFLLFGFTQKLWQKTLLILTIILMILFAGSATNVLVCLGCLALFALINFRRNKISTILFVGIVGVAIAYYIKVDTTFLDFIIGRTDTTNMSNEYSRNLLLFAFSPHTLMGTNFMATDYVTKGIMNEDIGLLPFMLNMCFLISYFKNTYLLLKKSDAVSLAVAFASLYYMLHAAKIGMTMYMQTLPLFLMYLQIFILNIWKNQNCLTKSIN